MPKPCTTEIAERRILSWNLWAKTVGFCDRFGPPLPPGDVALARYQVVLIVFGKCAESVDYACTNKTVGPKPIEVANCPFGCLLHLVSFVKWRCLRSLPHHPASRVIVNVSGTAATDLEGRLGRVFVCHEITREQIPWTSLSQEQFGSRYLLQVRFFCLWPSICESFMSVLVNLYQISHTKFTHHS